MREWVFLFFSRADFVSKPPVLDNRAALRRIVKCNCCLSIIEQPKSFPKFRRRAHVLSPRQGVPEGSLSMPRWGALRAGAPQGQIGPFRGARAPPLEGGSKRAQKEGPRRGPRPLVSSTVPEPEHHLVQTPGSDQGPEGR